LFYKRNTTKFFKNRYWIGREFNELSFNSNEQSSELNSKKIVLELGCGVGNFIFPVLESNPLLFIYACDFSKRAIEFVKVSISILFFYTIIYLPFFPFFRIIPNTMRRDAMHLFVI
jgi:2-polyprenyl-3-methyl-5-hydroxy-6-metoxy-1,4-benzoquinol methylase